MILHMFKSKIMIIMLALYIFAGHIRWWYRDIGNIIVVGDI
jgi:hypothetical protein